MKPREGPIDRVYTPVGGHRVTSLDQVNNSAAYVAALRHERFVLCEYTSIQKLSPFRSNRVVQVR